MDYAYRCCNNISGNALHAFIYGTIVCTEQLNLNLLKNIKTMTITISLKQTLGGNLQWELAFCCNFKTQNKNKECCVVLLIYQL